MGRKRTVPTVTQQEITDAIRSVEKRLGQVPSQAKFLAQSGINKAALLRAFPIWKQAVCASGLRPHRRTRPQSAEELIIDWGRVVRKLARTPSQIEYLRLGEFSWYQWKREFGRWAAAERAFREYAFSKPEWNDVIDILTRTDPNMAESEAAKANRLPPSSTFLLADTSRGLLELKNEWHKWLKERTPGEYSELAYGDPIDFRRLRNAPVNENGVILLFGMLAVELGLLIEAVQPGFPDCEAKYRADDGKWRRLRIEFEYESRNFLAHGHNPSQCDVIVCWKHNWKECPLQVIELSAAVKELKAA